MGLIETARVEQGRAPLWPLHLARLTASACALGLPLPVRLPSALDVVGAARDIAGVAAVRLTVDAEGVRLDARPVPPAGEGWHACAAPHARMPDALLAHKTTRRAKHEAAAAHARARGCQEALWLDPAGRLTEGAITNLFVCRRGRVLTPAAAGGLLPGIARGRLLAAGRLSGRPVEEADLRPEDLTDAEEAFVTNAARGAIPLLGWEGLPLRRGAAWQDAARAIFAGG